MNGRNENHTILVGTRGSILKRPGTFSSGTLNHVPLTGVPKTPSWFSDFEKKFFYWIFGKTEA